MNLIATLPLIFGLRGAEWIIILLVVLLLFGGKKIPELMRGLGKGVQSFKDGVADAKKEVQKTMDDVASEEPKKDAPRQTAKAKDTDE